MGIGRPPIPLVWRGREELESMTRSLGLPPGLVRRPQHSGL